MDISLEGQSWRLSDQRGVMVRNAVGNEAPKDLYARDDLLTQARQQLQQVHSFVTLAAQGEKAFKLRGDRAATEKDVQTAAYFEGRNKRGDRPASEAEMTADYYEGQNKLLGEGAETTITMRGVVAQYGGPTGAETQANPGRSGAYTRLGQRIQQTGVLNTPADCNETARVIMGVVHGPAHDEAEVAVTNRGNAEQVSTREDTDLRKPGNLPASLVETGGLSALKQSLIAYANVVPQRPVAVTHAVAVANYPAFLTRAPAVGSASNPAFAFRKLYDLKAAVPELYRDFVDWAGLDESVRPQVGDALVTYLPEGAVRSSISRHPRLYTALVRALVEVRHIDDRAAAQLLTGLEITPDTTFDRIVTLLSHEGVGQELGEAEDRAMLKAQGEHDLWNKHWAGVIITDGPDYVTLENDASTLGQGEFNTQWRFVLYGSARPGQSFHAHMLGSGDFGTVATTTRFRHK
jgi:hypothetical protein